MSNFLGVAREAINGLKRRWGAPLPADPTGMARSRAPHLTANGAAPGVSGMNALIDALPDATLLLDASFTLLHGNALARSLFGNIDLGAHVSRTTRSPDLAAAIAEAAKSGQRVLFELHIRGPIERRLEGAATALNPAGRAADTPYMLVVLQDLSERDALARMRVEFVANASHELRTPLTSLAGFIETLSGPAKEDPVARQRFLGIMAEQAGRMRRLIDDLLLLSRVEMRAHLAPTAKVNLNSVIADALKPLRQVAQDSKATLAVHPAPGDLIVHGDHDELVQAVQNLVQNAIKYGKPGGTVVVRPALAGARAVISVTDDGPGIAAEHLPRLTERFYRVSTMSSRDKGGTGLGLAIVKHIASRHHGRLDIKSEIGKGATFTLSLPLA